MSRSIQIILALSALFLLFALVSPNSYRRASHIAAERKVETQASMTSTTMSGVIVTPGGSVVILPLEEEPASPEWWFNPGYDNDCKTRRSCHAYDMPEYAIYDGRLYNVRDLMGRGI